MKKIFVLAAALSILACNNEKKKDSSAPAADTTHPVLAKDTSEIAKPAPMTIPGEGYVPIDLRGKRYEIPGSIVSSLTMRSEKGKGKGISNYYLQKLNDSLVLTIVEEWRGDMGGESVDRYDISLKDVDPATGLTLEEVKSASYPGGLIYVINIECRGKKDCARQTFSQPVNPTDTRRNVSLLQLIFSEKSTAERYLEALKGSK